MRVRVSTEEQAERGYSIEEQDRLIREAIKKNGWGEPVDMYRDAGWSGAREDRPDFQRMLGDLDRFDVVVIWAMDRLTRDLLMFAKLVKQFTAAKVRIESLTAHVDLGTPEGEAMAGIAAVFGQFERKRIGERVKACLDARARQGRHTGGAAPYGYTWQDKDLVVEPSEAEVVKRIYADYCNGLGQRGIVRALNAERVPTRHGGDWQQSSISRLLSAPLYIGKLEYDGEVWPGRHEAIIGEDTWNRVQAIKSGEHRRKGGRQADSPHLLTRGILRCPTCGSAMIPRKARPGVERDRYVCRGRIERGTGFCAQPSIRRELIDEPFLSHLLDGYIDIEATRRRIEERTSSLLGRARDAVTEREREVARIERALQTTERDYDAGDLTGKQYSGRQARLSDELTGATNALSHAVAHTQRLEQDEPVGDTEQMLLDLLARLKQAASAQADAAPDLPALRNLIGDMFESIQMVRSGEWPPAAGPIEGFTPFEGDVPASPQVEDGRYWLLTSLRWSAVDTGTFKPIGHEIPVAVWQAYPDGFLCRYCWW